MYFPSDTSPFNVLIVESDPVVLNLLTHLLEMGHHRVRCASDGNQALQMVLQDCPDVLITDLLIPGLDGLDLCRRVRKLHTQKVLPHYSYIILLSAQYGKHTIVEGLESGADDFIARDVTSLSNFRAEIQARLNAALRIRRLEAGLEYAAKYDSLTQLLNRVAFFEAGQVHWDRSIRNKTPLAAVMMDCDLFKRVNDIYGHSAGDSVLNELAAILRGFSRSSDVICRYGGEEFCAILPGCNEADAWDWANRIRQQCESIPIRHAGVDISITVSFGVAERTPSTGLLDHLVDQADQAMLVAKERGRNRCISYSEVMSSSTKGSWQIMTELFDNVTARDVMIPFHLSIQPHVPVATVADYFLRTPFNTLPITDHEGKLVGTISTHDIMPMIGQHEPWVSPIKQFIHTNAASYPVDTPIRTIVDFFDRTSVRDVMIVQNNVLLGYIGHTQLLRWLRNQWAMNSGKYSDIIPEELPQEMFVNHVRSAIESLKEELAHWESAAAVTDNAQPVALNYERMVSVLFKCHEITDQALNFSSLPTQDAPILRSEPQS
ncbi:MAG: diguanylate cyclase [Planctomycetaceae bacterium]|jgi:diguanylate cyclase (GGDEF)-like protein|nr:diguanylate cyclase [Planctomycetaceae bacterium]